MNNSFILSWVLLLSVLAMVVRLMSKNLRQIISFLFLFPSPIFNSFITKCLNKIVQNNNLDAVLQLHDHIKKRFGDINKIPVVIEIHQDLYVKQTGSDSVFFDNNSDVKWLVNNKMAVVFLKKEHISTVLTILSGFFSGAIGHAVNFHLKHQETPEDIAHVCDLIFSITKRKAPVVLIYDVENMHLQSLTSLLSKKNSLGCTFENEYKFNTNFEEFLLNLMHDIILSEKTTGNQISLDLLYISNKKPFIQKNLDYISNSTLYTRGVFFLCYDKLNLTNNIDFAENLYNIDIYNLCNESQSLGSYTTQKMFFMKNILLFFLGAIMSFNIFNHFSGIKQRLNNIETCVFFVDEVKKNTFHERQILNHLKNMKIHDINIFAKLFARQDLKKISVIRRFLLHSSFKTIDNMSIEKTSDNFSFSPSSTKTFQNLSYNVNTLCDMMEDLQELFQRNEFYNLNIQLEEYQEAVRQKILDNFQNFIAYFNNYTLLNEINYFQKLLMDLYQNPSIKTIEEILERKKTLKPLLKLSSNQWWITKNLGNEYDNIINRIKELKSIGSTLYHKIVYTSHNELLKIHDQIMDSNLFYIKHIFIIEDSSIRFSDETDHLIYYLQNLKNNEIINFNKNNILYSTPGDNEISLWDLDVLEKILQKTHDRNMFFQSISSYPLEVRSLAGKIYDNNIYQYINHNLSLSQSLFTSEISIEEKINRLAKAVVLIEKINSFVKKSLGLPPPRWVNFLLANSFDKIINELKHILEQGVFTSYKKLHQWKGEPLIKFLFNCNAQDLSFILNNNIEYLISIKDKFMPLLPILSEINPVEYRFLKHVFDELVNYSNGQKNNISAFENDINDLNNWEIKWRDDNINFSSKEDFFNYHRQAFNKAMVLNTNRIVFELSKIYYNELVNKFNEFLSGRFPFGNGPDVNRQELMNFLKLYNKYRNHLINDKIFMAQNLKITIQMLDCLNNFFLIENDILYIKAKIQYHNPDGKNIYLIKNYFSKFGEQIFNLDTVDIQFKAHLGFALGIEIINSSDFKIYTDNDYGNKIFVNKKKFSYLNDFGFLHFIHNNIDRVFDNNIVLKINIPIKSITTNENDEIVSFIKIFDCPYFFESMESLD